MSALGAFGKDGSFFLQTPLHQQHPLRASFLFFSIPSASSALAEKRLLYTSDWKELKDRTLYRKLKHNISFSLSYKVSFSISEALLSD